MTNMMMTGLDEDAPPALALRDLPTIRRVSVEQLQQLGVSELAYMKPVLVEGMPAWSIHAADGNLMAVTDDRAVAIDAIERQDMALASVH